mmetsp:Transcript_35690/g.66098  ORF Transcript_35690/g.66098 Transcript_35690/m.66098 type:complete len:205 (+) Transcript_35690:2206-2820(+)
MEKASNTLPPSFFLCRFVNQYARIRDVKQLQPFIQLSIEHVINELYHQLPIIHRETFPPWDIFENQPYGMYHLLGLRSGKRRRTFRGILRRLFRRTFRRLPRRFRRGTVRRRSRRILGQGFGIVRSFRHANILEIFPIIFFELALEYLRVRFESIHDEGEGEVGEVRWSPHEYLEGHRHGCQSPPPIITRRGRSSFGRQHCRRQ